MPDNQRPPDPVQVRTTPAVSLERRRDVLRLLRAAGGSLALVDLAADLCSGRGNALDPDVNWDGVERCATRLHHRDLPKLEAAGVVTFDTDRRIAALEA